MKKNILKRAAATIFILIIFAFCSSCEQECAHEVFSENIIAPTCDSEGKTEHTCTACGYQFYTDSVAPLGHTLKTTIFEPTCEAEGYTYYSCDCGYSYKSDFIPSLGHEGEEKYVAPTCSAEGYTLVDCTRCNREYKKDFIPPISHNLKSEDFLPTCTEPGYTQYSCLECNFSYIGNLIEPYGHSFTEKQVGATITHAGYTLHTCECEYSYKSNFLYYNEIFTSSYVESSVPISKGLDISKWNHETGATSDDYLPLDWNALYDAGFEFVILRAGYTGVIDPTFEMNYSAAKEAGFKVGVYFYTYATTPDSAREEADTLLKWLSGKQFELPIFLDVEDDSLKSLEKDELTDVCIAFIERMQENFYYTGLYCNNEFLTNYLDSQKLLDKVDIWYARYWYGHNDPPISVDDTQFVWNSDKYGKQLSIWQYADTGIIDGFGDMNFDFNYCYKDFEAVIKENNLNGY